MEIKTMTLIFEIEGGLVASKNNWKPCSVFVNCSEQSKAVKFMRISNMLGSDYCQYPIVHIQWTGSEYVYRYEMDSTTTTYNHLIAHALRIKNGKSARFKNSWGKYANYVKRHCLFYVKLDY